MEVLEVTVERRSLRKWRSSSGGTRENGATLYIGVSHLTLSQSIGLQEEAEARNAAKSTTIVYTSVLLGNHSATSTTSCFCLA
ncbi:hypothetical protein NL676_038288 [Syzygium grande]|nr:hypothetical protein NL676_038288 [Syzygium grande]